MTDAKHVALELEDALILQAENSRLRERERALRKALRAIVSQLMRCSDLSHFPELGDALDAARAALAESEE